VAGNDALDPTLVYAYDDSPLGTPLTPVTLPLSPAAGDGHQADGASPVEPRRADWSGLLRALVQRRPHPVRWLGDSLLFLASVDRDQVGSRGERYRYQTIAVLMLLTGVQACYSAALFMAVSLGRSLRGEIWFGVAFAAAVIFIDRSIISYAPKARLDKKTRMPATPRKLSGVLLVRLVIAIAAALLMSEMILLQVFAGDIGEQIQVNQLHAKQAADTQIEATYKARIAKLQQQITDAQNNVNQQKSKADAAYQAMNCQEFGCRANGVTIAAGTGPGFRAAQQNYDSAQAALTDAQQHLQTVTSEVQPEINLDNAQEQTAINTAQGPISNADKVLSQEEALWQLMVTHGTVLATRIVLELLILGIDLAPILTKLSGRISLHDTRAYYSDIDALEKERHDVTTSLYKHQGRAQLDRQVHDLEVGDAFFEAQRDSTVARAKGTADGQVSRYTNDLNAHRRMLWAHHRYLIGRPPPSSWPQADGARDSRLRPWSRGVNPDADSSDDDRNVTAAFGLQGIPSGSDAGQAGSRFMGAPVGSLDTIAPSEDPARPAADPFAPPAGPPAPPAELGPPAWTPDPVPGPDGSYWTRTSGQIEEQAFIYSAQQAAQEGEVRAMLGGRWVLHGPLPGADPGGGGTVLRAKDGRSQDQSAWYVVKTVPSGEVQKSARRSIRQLGLRHEKRAAAVTSEHVGEVLDHGEDNGFFFLVYPLYEPGSLSGHCDRLRERLTLTLPWCAKVVHEVLTGLMAAADVGLVHLDIKPGNIVMDGDRARLIDWGLSRKFDATRPSTWVARGTPYFACPEQLSGSAPGWDTPRADLYGVGALFYWLLTGEPPLWQDAGENGDDPFGYRSLILAGVRPQRVDELVPGVPRELGLLINRWLSFDPADRVPQGTPVRESIRVARTELDALRPALPNITVGRITGRRRGRRT
jgi:hypothetical protein